MRLGDRVIRVSTTAAVVLVAAVVALVSYKHAVAVIEQWGEESWLTARLIPATVDGLMGTSSMILLWCGRYRLPVPRLARWALGLGIVATIGTNALHGLSRGLLAAAIAAWPAVALVISYELLMWVVKSGRELADVGQAPPAEPYEPAKPHRPDVVVVPDLPVTGADFPVEAPDLPVASVSEPSPTPVQLDQHTPEPSPTVGDESESDRLAIVVGLLSDDPDVSGAEIGRRFGLTPRQGLRIKNAAVASLNGKH